MNSFSHTDGVCEHFFETMVKLFLAWISFLYLIINRILFSVDSQCMLWRLASSVSVTDVKILVLHIFELVEMILQGDTTK